MDDGATGSFKEFTKHRRRGTLGPWVDEVDENVDASSGGGGGGPNVLSPRGLFLLMNRGDAAAATWMLRADESRRRRGCR